MLSKALSYTFDRNAIVTIGIKPSRPETGYGYIAASEPTSVDEIYKVEAFKEKPNLETAEQYLAAGNYYWNAGIFVWNIDTISKAIRDVYKRQIYWFINWNITFQQNQLYPK